MTEQPTFQSPGLTKTKDFRTKTTYTMDLIAGVNGFADESPCTMKVAAKKVCARVSEQGITPSPPGGGPGPGPGSIEAFTGYKLKCPKQVVPPLVFQDELGAGTFSPSTAKFLLVPALGPSWTPSTTTTSTTSPSTTTTSTPESTTTMTTTTTRLATTTSTTPTTNTTTTTSTTTTTLPHCPSQFGGPVNT